MKRQTIYEVPGYSYSKWAPARVPASVKAITQRLLPGAFSRKYYLSPAVYL